MKYEANKELIAKAIEEERTKYNDEESFYRYGEMYDDKKLTEKEYNSNLDEMLKHLDRMSSPKYIGKAIASAERKKNGTFYKGKIYERVGCNNTTFIQEWHNTWIYNALTVKATDDNTLTLSYDSITDTPG